MANALVVVGFLILWTMLSANAESPTILITYRRSTEKINSITLSCLDGMGQPVPSAQFFRNKMVFQDGIRNGDDVSFIATRNTEGNFSCGLTGQSGTVVMSPAEPIVALPDNNIDIKVDVSYARINNQARINCSIPPSQIFRNRYLVRWINASNPQETFYSFNAGSNDFTRKSPRYNLDPKNFSLLISRVQPLDGISEYRCILSVFDQSMWYTFDATTQLNLSLVVFVPPAFNLLPRPIVTAQRRDRNATFQCEVRSAPEASRIVWYFRHGNEEEVQVRESAQYHVENITQSEGGTKLTHGEVTALELNGFSSGEIRCEAQYVVTQFGVEQSLVRRSAVTTLTVLSRPTDLEALPTEDGGFVFRVTLNDALPIPVAVQLRFRDMETNQITRGTQSDVFMNTRTITIFRNSVPYQRFQVGVGVVYENVVSQWYRDNTIYEQSNCEKEALTYGVLSICEAMTIFLLLLILFVIVCTHALEGCLKQDEGHRAAKLLAKVNCKRRITPLLLKRKNRGITNSQEVQLVPEKNSKKVEEDGDSDIPYTASGFTDKLATSYVNALKMAINFGLKDQKIKKELVMQREHFRIDSDEPLSQQPEGHTT